MKSRIASVFVGLLLVAGTFTALTAPAEARSIQLSLYNTGTRYLGQLVPMRGFMQNAGTRHDKVLLLQQFTGGKWRTVDRKTHRANGGFRFRGHRYTKPVERRFRVVAQKNGRTIKVSKPILVRVKSRTAPTPPANSRPVAADDVASVIANATTSIPVLANDTDANGDKLTITRVGVPDHGTATIAAGAVSYTPTPGYTGADTFDYAISDGKGGTNSAVVHVTVTAAPAAPGTPFTVNVRVTADAQNFIQESDETNNDAFATVTIAGDSVTNVVATGGVTPGQALTFSAGESGATASGTARNLLPDLRMKRLDACGGSDLTASINNHGMKCFFIAHPAPGKTLLKFVAITLNAGLGPLEVNSTRINAAAGTASWNGTGVQRIYQDTDGDNIYETDKSTDRVSTGLQFYWADIPGVGSDAHGHMHWHMKDFDAYSIVDGSGATVPGGINEKHGFCFEDNTTTTEPPGAPLKYAHDTSCGFAQPNTATIQHGLSPGWGDTYPTTLPDQGIDVTALVPPA